MSPSDSKKSDDLEKILEITRRMAAAVELDELLKLIINHSIELLDAERASLFLYEPSSNELVSRVAVDAGEIRFPADKGIAGATVRAAKTINVRDAHRDPRFNPEIDRQTGFHTRNILSVPLRDHENKLVGVLQVLNKRSGQFTKYDVGLAEALGAQAGVSLQRASLIEHFIRKQEMERAMEIARDIQRGLLPKVPPPIAGFDVSAFTEAADETGGDIYDFLALPDGRWMLLVADATGHGVGPALLIAETRAMLRAISSLGSDVPAVFETTNKLLAADLTGGRFVTCFMGMLEEKSASLKFASAGHGPLIFYNRRQDKFTQFTGTSLPLGIMTEADFTDAVDLKFQTGDFLAITTDGFFEAENPNREQFGVNRMIKLMRRCRDMPAGEMIEKLRKAVTDFTSGRKPADDLTAVVVRKT
ncbi:MAG: PP2C family protein-serine/threonine phosphatase [Planctomycetota bacterium]